MPNTGTDIVTVIPSPNKPTFSQHGDTLISSSKYDNQWYYNDSLLVNDTSQDLIITSLGEYWVVVNNEAEWLQHIVGFDENRFSDRG